MATAFFVISKIFIWILKLIYSTVYHLTYIFAPITALLYFFGWTNNSLKGSVQASIWCMLMPFVVVAILILVGNSMDQSAKDGELVIAHIDTIVWLFGVTLLLLLTPLITLGLVRGDGVQTLGTKMGAMMMGAGLKAGLIFSTVKEMKSSTLRGLSSLSKSAQGFKEKLSGKSEKNSATSQSLAGDQKNNLKDSSKESQSRTNNNTSTGTQNQNSTTTREKESSNNATFKEIRSSDLQSKRSKSSTHSNREQNKIEQGISQKQTKEAPKTLTSKKQPDHSKQNHQMNQRTMFHSQKQDQKQVQRIMKKEQANELRRI